MNNKMMSVLVSLLFTLTCFGGVITSAPSIQPNQFTTNTASPTASITVSNVTAQYYYGNGLGLTSIPAGALSGTLPYGVLPQYANTNGSSIIDTNFGGFTAQGTASFTGSGAGLTGVSSNSITSINPSQIYPTISSGGNVYSNLPVILTNNGNVFAGTYSGNGSGLTNLNTTFPITGAAIGTFMCQTDLGGIYFLPSNCPPSEITPRPTVTTYPVLTLTTPTNSQMAVDLTSGLNAVDPLGAAGYGMIFEDISANCNTNAPSPFTAIHLSHHATFEEISAVCYNSGTADPFVFGYGAGVSDTAFLECIPVTGNVGIGSSKNLANPTNALQVEVDGNGATVLSIINTNTGANVGSILNFANKPSAVSGYGNSLYGFSIEYWSTNSTKAITFSEPAYGPAVTVFHAFADTTNGINFLIDSTTNNAIYRWYAGGPVTANQIATLNQQGTFSTTNIAANTMAVSTNTASWFVASTSATTTITNGASNGKATEYITVATQDSATGTPMMLVQVPGLFTNFYTLGNDLDTVLRTNTISVPIQPGYTNTWTDVSTGSGATVTAIKSWIVQ